MARPSESPKDDILRLPLTTVLDLLIAILTARGFTRSRAWRCAYTFTENSLVGGPSHGLNRFPRFVEWIDRERIDVDAHPSRLDSHGAFERWDGKLGPGPVNAARAMHRAMRIALRYGIGCVALSNTNHWLRAGSYVARAAEKGFLAVCTTNTEPNLAAWGTDEACVGNNPIALSVPRTDGHHVVFDGALSQFSYGSLERAARRGETLPVPGGFNESGDPTTNPAEILRSQRALPIGYWKGSALSLLLDLFVSGLADGRSTREIGQLDAEHGVCQLFVAFAPFLLTPHAIATLEQTLANYPTRYPGQRAHRAREENRARGVPVDATVWSTIHTL